MHSANNPHLFLSWNIVLLQELIHDSGWRFVHLVHILYVDACDHIRVLSFSRDWCTFWHFRVIFKMQSSRTWWEMLKNKMTNIT